MLNSLETWAVYISLLSLVVAVLSLIMMIVIWIWPRPQQVPPKIRIGVLIIFVAALSFFLGIGVATLGHKPPCEDATWLFQQGVNTANAKEYDQAIKWYREALGCGYKPKSDINYRLGDIYYYGKQELELALDQYTEAIQNRYRDQAAAYLQRGRVYSEKWVHHRPTPDDSTDYNLAMEDFKKAIELGGSPGELYLSIGALQVNAHKYQEAIASITQAVEQDHKLIQSYTWLGRAYAGLATMKDADAAAAAAFDKAIQQATTEVSTENSPRCQNVFLEEAYQEFRKLAESFGLLPQLTTSLERALQSTDVSCRTWADQKLQELAKPTPTP